MKLSVAQRNVLERLAEPGATLECWHGDARRPSHWLARSPETIAFVHGVTGRALLRRGWIEATERGDWRFAEFVISATGREAIGAEEGQGGADAEGI